MSSEARATLFIDAKPSEQIQLREADYLCLVALSPSRGSGPGRLKAYKRTQRSEKPVVARRLAEALRSGELGFSAMVLSGRMTGHFVQWAIETLNRSRDILGFRWILNSEGKPECLEWGDVRFNLPLALGLALYANLLALVGLWASNVAKRQTDGISFEIGNLKRYKDGGTWRRGDQHPYALLTDWLAAGAIAALNPGQLLAEAEFGEDELADLASLYYVASELGAVRALDVDDPELAAKVIAHNRRLS